MSLGCSHNSGSVFPEAKLEQERCHGSGGVAQPLVLEWSAAERANLQAMAARGAVAVAFTGCTLQVVPECSIAGSYQYTAITPATDRFDVRSRDELALKLPLAVGTLVGALAARARSGRVTRDDVQQSHNPSAWGQNPQP